MNKRDLIKALFKDPTIKALYESGHFKATDINRAILTEASELEEVELGASDSAWRNFLNANPELRTDFQQKLNKAEERLVKYQAAKSWDNLKRDFAHRIPDEATEESFKVWREKVLPLIEDQYNSIIKNARAKLTKTATSLAPEPDKKKDAQQTINKSDEDIENVTNQVQDKIEDVANAAPEVSEMPKELKDYLTVYEEIVGNRLDDVELLKDKPHRKAFVVYFLQQKMEKGEAVDLNEKVKYYATAVEFFKKFVEEKKAEAIAQAMESQAKGPIIDFLKDNDSIGKLQGLLNNKTDKQPEDTGVSELDQESSAFDQVFQGGLGFVNAPDNVDGKSLYKYKETGKPLIEKIRKAAIMKAFGSESELFPGTINNAVNGEAIKLIKGIDQSNFDYITIGRVVSEEFKKALKDNFDSIKATYDKNIGSVKTDEPAESSVDPEVIAKFEEFLRGANEQLLELVNKYPKFKELLAVAYVKALEEKPEETATTPEPPTPETSTASTSPQSSPPEEAATATMEESINRALSGIFLIENEGSAESTEDEAGSPASPTPDPTSDNEGGGPISVGDAAEVEQMLEDLKTVFDAANLEIDVQAIWKLSQQKEEPEDKRDTGEDVSPPDLAEFQENWTEVLMTFFGKNPNSSSFMRRLLLSSQAEMLHGVIKVLQDISDPEKMAAYTDMNQDDEREKKADKTKDKLEEGLLGDSISDAEEEERNRESRTQQLKDQEPELKAAQQASMRKAAQDSQPASPEPNQPTGQPSRPRSRDTVQELEIPPRNRRIIKQDLQSMVDLLRQVKKAIGSYSQYSTQKSGDPRFDGSTLKKDMDNLLAQVQDDIYDLWSNLKPVDLDPEEDDSNLEEALSGIVLEDADPERQEKIKLVREVYDKAKEEYIYTLMPSMKGNDWGKSQTSAKQILDILKKDEFISLFPTVTKTTGGRVMTLGEAHDSMKQIIQEFIETVRDIVLISKTKYISSTSLTQAKRNLLYISREIAALFRVPSKFSTAEIKQAKEEEAAKPENQAITTEPTENLENASEDNNPGSTSPENTPDPNVEDGEEVEPSTPEQTSAGEDDEEVEPSTPEQTSAGEDGEEAAGADEDGDDEIPRGEEVERIRKDIAEYERKAGTGEAKDIMEDFLSQEGAKKLGKDSIEALYSIIEIAKLIVKNFAGDWEEVSESVSKIFNKIKKSANAFMQNQKARSNFSKFEDEFRRYLGHRSEKAKPYLMYLLKFMNGAELGELLKVLEENNGDITEARKEMKDLYTPSPTDSDVDNLEEALKPIIETMLKEHYNH